MKSLTQTVTFEVSIDTETDMFLRAISARYTRATNKALSAIFAVKAGALPPPPPEISKSENMWLYDALINKWQPWGEPLLEGSPKNMSHIVNQITQYVTGIITRRHNNKKSSWPEILAGERSLPTYREMPIFVRASGVSVVTVEERPAFSINFIDHGDVKKNVIFVPRRKTDRWRWARLNLIAQGKVKLGAVTLTPKANKCWQMALSYTQENMQQATAKVPMIVGVDMGMRAKPKGQRVAVAAVLHQNGSLESKFEIYIPSHVGRRLIALEDETASRRTSNREEYKLRVGHGVHGKMKANIAESSYANLRQDAMRKAAFALVSAARKSGATALVMEDLSGFTNEFVARTAHLSHKRRAVMRRTIKKFPHGMFTECIQHAAHNTGMTFLAINPKNTSKTCSGCGKVYAHYLGPDEGGPVGRAGELFFCVCANKVMDADVNAAINIARIGLDKLAKSK